MCVCVGGGGGGGKRGDGGALMSSYREAHVVGDCGAD